MTLDPRITPVRPDLAAAHLRGRVSAPRYAEGTEMEIGVGSVPLRETPGDDGRFSSEMLYGGRVICYDAQDGWAWIQAREDDYVGYLPARALRPAGPPATHWVKALHTFLQPAPDLKRPPRDILPMTAHVACTGREEEGYAELADGQWVFAAHLSSLGRFAPAPLSVADQFLGVPYLWGGRTSRGIDCSGLVQIAMTAAGRSIPRDTEMQCRAIERPLPPDAPLKAGDVVYFPGHVGIMRDTETLLHANAWSMSVAAHPLADVVARIAEKEDQPVTAIWRPTA